MKYLYKFFSFLLVLLSFSFFSHPVHASTSERVYVANTSANTVSVIDSVTNNVISTVPVGQNPGYKIAVSPDGSKVYVPNITDGTVSVIEAQSNSVVTTISVGGEADDIAIKSDGSQVYVANLSNTLVQVINTQTDAVDQTIDVGDTTKCLLMTPDGSRLYVADFTNNAISVVNTSSNTISSVITGFGKDPCGMAITPDNSKLYVSTYDSQTGAHAVAVINANTNALITTVPMNTLSGLAMSPDGSKVYVVNDNCCGGGNGTVTVLDTQTNGVIATITVGLTPNHAVVSSDGSTIYVDDQGSNSVSVIDGTTNTEVSQITVGTGPNGLGIGIAPNLAPNVGAITVATSPVQVNTAITASANFTDSQTGTHTAKWYWGDGNTTTGTVTEPNGSNPGSVSNTHTYAATGVYTITLTVTNTSDGGTGTAQYQYVAVYDSTTSFAGGSSFDNPASASPNTTGKVKFGISAKYNNSNVLTGSAKMNFKAASLDFASTSLSSLATSNGKAYLKGSGTVNGLGNYTFLATGIDGSVVGGNDLIRFQIKDASNNVVYDSQPGAGDTTDPTTTDATGNIRVH